jgi:cytidine deaminase
LRMAELLPYAFDVADLDAVGGAAAHAPVVPARLAAWRGRGTVFVHRDMVGGEPVWTAYWERTTGEDDPERPGILEEAPTWPDQSDAVAWARARTARVVIIDADGALTSVDHGVVHPEKSDIDDDSGCTTP